MRVNNDQLQREKDDLNDLIKTLGNQLSEPVMKSTARLIIIISLAINKRLFFF